MLVQPCQDLLSYVSFLGQQGIFSLRNQSTFSEGTKMAVIRFTSG